MKHLNEVPNLFRTNGDKPGNHVATDGHCYELENFEDKSTPGQVLRFIEKQPKEGGAPGELVIVPGELVTVMDGTTNEEVLKMLIHRLGCQSTKFPSRETAIAITKIEEALMWLEKRTRDRSARGVEGKALA